MDDLISRQAVLDIADDLRDQMTVVGYCAMTEMVKALPSAQPETHEERTETHACDCISRQAVTDTVRTIILGFFSKDGAMTDTEKTLLRVNKAICNGVRELPSAQQDCTECEEYDSERHSCQKYCDVIRQTIEEAKQKRTGRWIEYDNSHCECPFCHVEWSYFDNEVECFNYCPNCGERMEDGADGI